MTDHFISIQSSAFIRQYRHRNARRKHPEEITITARDTAIIEAVYKCRALTQAQIEQLVLNGKHNSYSGNRLASLFDCGYLYRHFLPTPYGIAPSPIVYVLDKRGADLLTRHYEQPIKWTKWQKTITPSFLLHTLELNDVRIAITQACKTTEYTIEKWIGEHEIKANYDRVSVGGLLGKKETLPILPDGYFILTHQNAKNPPLHFFVELDRGTMQQHRFQAKIRAYSAYYKSGAYTRKYGTRSFRLLTITPGERRSRYLKAATEAVGGRGKFWFTSLPKLMTSDVFTASIWQVAGRDGEFVLLSSREENRVAA